MRPATTRESGHGFLRVSIARRSKHFVGQPVLSRGNEMFGQTEISDMGHAVLVDEQAGGLQVPMDNSTRGSMVERLGNPPEPFGATVTADLSGLLRDPHPKKTNGPKPIELVSVMIVAPAGLRCAGSIHGQTVLLQPVSHSSRQLNILGFVVSCQACISF